MWIIIYILLCILFPVPNGTWAWWANGSYGSHGATSHERITRLVLHMPWFYGSLAERIGLMSLQIKQGFIYLRNNWTDFSFASSGSGDMDGLPKVRKKQIFSKLLVFIFWWLAGCFYRLNHLFNFTISTFPHFNLFFYRLHLQSSPNNMGGMNNPPGTPRDDGEMGGNFLNPFQSESVSRSEWMASHDP